MTRTWLTQSQGASDSNQAQGYLNETAVSHWDFDCVAPAGAIRSCAHDVLVYLEAQMSGKDKAMQLSHQTTFSITSNRQVALAWHLLPLSKDKTIVWHNGGTGGFSTFAGMDLKSGTAIIVMANNGKIGSADQPGIDILKKLLL